MQRTKSLVAKLLNWYCENARDLPWRRTRDPYAIWISEIMLQQTQVATVIPYWKRWMKRLPTIEKLARAKPDTILKLWEGLGYYTRVRNIHKAAKQIVAECDGKFPTEFDDILKLPGIGRYTAGAITSIAFNEPKSILDGNVIRVLTRVYAIEGDPTKNPTNNQLWEMAANLVQECQHAEDENLPTCSYFNQSLMELGALICTPKNPKCESCPVNQNCIAYQKNRIAEFPNSSASQKTKNIRRFVFVLENKNRYLLSQRSKDVVNAEMWEFPNIEFSENNETPQRALGDLLKLKNIKLTPFGKIKHAITNHRIELHIFSGKVRAAKNLPRSRWFTLTQIDSLSLPSAHRKILNRLGKT